MFPKARSESVLFITLDSCRYDTFIDADIPNLRKVGPIYRAMAPGNFTFSSHAAMFMGFTPGVAEAEASFVNPMVGKIFKMLGGGFSGPGRTGGLPHPGRWLDRDHDDGRPRHVTLCCQRLRNHNRDVKTKVSL